MLKYIIFFLCLVCFSCQEQIGVDDPKPCLMSKVYNIADNKLTNSYIYDDQNRLIEYQNLGSTCKYIYKLDYSIKNQVKISYTGDCLPQQSIFYPGVLYLDNAGNVTKIETPEKNSKTLLLYENQKLKNFQTINSINGQERLVVNQNFVWNEGNISKVIYSYDDKVSKLKYTFTAYETYDFDQKLNYQPKGIELLTLYAMVNSWGISYNSLNQNICTDYATTNSQNNPLDRRLIYFDYDIKGNPNRSGSAFYSNNTPLSKNYSFRYEFVCD